jgi:cell division protein FtsN
MSNFFDRGVYEPGEDVRVFDGSEDDEDVEGSRLPLLIVLALLVLAMFAGVVWLAYTQGVARGRTETPVLTAQNGPARVAPQNPGGAEEPYKGFKIYEQPAPPDDDAAATTTPAVAAALATRPVVAPPPKPVTAAAPLTPPPALKMATAIPEPAKTAPVTARTPAPVVVKKALPQSAPVARATAPPRSLAPPALKPAPVPAPTAASGSYALQIGAYKSQAEADAAWKTYKTRHGALLAGANDDVQQADLGEKGIWYRLRITGFPSKDVASAMCDRLKADGGGCFLGK